MRAKIIFILWLILTVFLISAFGQQTTEDWNDRGNALCHQGEYDEAIKAYDEAIKINPKDEKAWVNKGTMRQFTLLTGQ